MCLRIFDLAGAMKQPLELNVLPERYAVVRLEPNVGHLKGVLHFLNILRNFSS